MDDATLLSHYARHRDAEAFAEILNRHSGLVYGTCLRVLGDRHRAEDAAQDCFLALAEHAGSIRQSLSAWLHRVALHAALKLRRRQQPASEVDVSTIPAPLVSTWRTLAPQLDAALEGLPEEVREIITCRYLAGRTQAQIGQDLGVSQATVSRRLEQGVALLRSRLTRQLDEHAIEGAMSLALVQAPASMLASCGRIGLAGVGGPTGAATGGWSLAAKVAVAALLVGGGALGAVVGRGTAARPAAPAHAAGAPVATACAAAPAENTPSPAPVPAPAPAAGTALCSQLVTINVRGWPLTEVIDTLSDQLQLDHARLEILPSNEDQTLVDASADQQPLGAVLD
jgi:RNA polymerase sigma factor (sigma-70 family)